MSAPDVVVLDTRGATDKASFLAATATSLGFPEYQGNNWDAFEESLRDFVADRAPVLVVWTGASTLPDDVRNTAIDIMTDNFTEGADIVIVDDVTAGAQPDFALDSVQLAIPEDGDEAAHSFWTDVVGLEDAGGLSFAGEALNLSLAVDLQFAPATVAGPAIMVRDVSSLIGRLQAGGHPVESIADDPVAVFDTNDPFGNRIRFIAF